MKLFWIIIVTAASVTASTSLNFWLLSRARQAGNGVWLLEHIICPIIRILVLLIIVSLVYPVIGETLGSLDVWRLLGREGGFNDLLNSLFLASLILGFLPLLNHPVFALPIQSCLAIAMIFHWQYPQQVDALALLPSPVLLLKITGYMLFAYLLTREASIPVARWIDDCYHSSGSIRLVADAIYLLLQIPVMLIYCGFLQRLLPGQLTP